MKKKTHPADKMPGSQAQVIMYLALQFCLLTKPEDKVPI